MPRTARPITSPPASFTELGAEVTAIGCQPDGFNINAGFGATAPASPGRRGPTSGADYGVALDGDADRVQMVDASGRLYNGDELLYVLAVDRLEQGGALPAWSAP
jgi:phosphoglucosamine mutase